MKPAEREAHLQAVRARTARGLSLVDERVRAINARLPQKRRGQLIDQAMRSKTVPARVLWLRRAADATLEAAAGWSACTRGCSHCCHIPTLVSEAEARVIGRALGQTPFTGPIALSMRTPPVDALVSEENAIRTFQATLAERFVGVACPFLVDGDCSIYAQRPLACRHLVNLDRDDLLCRLVPGTDIDVPYLDTRIDKLITLHCLGAGQRLADIRDWFPARHGA